MKIAVIGPGAMGQLFGGYLSRKNDVMLIGRNPKVMQQADEQGIIIREQNGEENVFHPHATVSVEETGPVDLVLLFVKSGASLTALQTNQSLIGPQTILMTLQNGMGHENILREFAPEENIIIGTTQQGSFRLSDTAICHSGLGDTTLGVVTGNADRFAPVAQTFTECGFPCTVSDKVRGMVWNKLMINASSSVLSGILQVPQGYVQENAYAWQIACSLITELCTVATADGYPFDAAEQIDRIKKHLQAAPDGFTSIYADLKAGRRTEVDTINGAVVAAAEKYGIDVPAHRMTVAMVHAMEGRNQ